MSQKTIRVMKEMEQREGASCGQSRVVRTVMTSTSSSRGGEHISTEDFFSKFEGTNLLDKSSSQSGYVTRTVRYESKDGKVTESTSETIQHPSIMQKHTSSAKQFSSTVIEKSTPTKTKSSPTKTFFNKFSPKKATLVEKSPAKTTSAQKSSPISKSDNTTPSAPSITTGNFTDDCLKKHNYYRIKHGVPPLKLSSTLCQYAQEWANHLAATDTFQHRPNNKYGENIFMEWSSNPNIQLSGEKSVDSWYSEIKVHKFGREPTSLSSGHFTQVIWKSSKEVGMAYARNKGGKIYVVANYEPAGNMMGQFASHVPPPKS